MLWTHHNRCLHEGGFRIARDSNGQLRFQRADGRTIPRFGYRVEDFTAEVADDVTGDCGDACYENPSAEGFWPTDEVREPVAVYRLTPSSHERAQPDALWQDECDSRLASSFGGSTCARY